MYLDGTGNGSKDFLGLANLVSSTPTTGTKGGINVATFSFFRNQQTTGTQTTSAFDNLRASMRTSYNNCSKGVNEMHPTFGVTTQTVFEGFEALLVANERFTDKTNGDGAFKNDRIKFKGMMLAFDVACTSGCMYLLNPAFLKLVYKTGAWMKMLEAVRPANQTVEVTPIRSMGNLIATQPRRLGVISAIS